MAEIVFVSGPCGCGKTAFTDELARVLAYRGRKAVYVIHGDDFHKGFVEYDEDGDGGFFPDGEASDKLKWEEILRFNWDCILSTAERALKQGMDVIIDYVIEGELSRITGLAERNGAELYYIVLTAREDVIVERIRQRGDTDMIERAKFLKRKLDSMPENAGHLYDNSDISPEQSAAEIDLKKYILQ